MISRTCFERKWITTKHSKTNADPILIEKAIYALELLGILVENGINLIFKGGTGLMLLIPELKRLSIIKQLFDLGILFECITDLKEISQSYKKVAGLAFLIKDGRLDMDIEVLKQNRGDVERIMDVLLPEEFGILNKLKAVSPESFYLSHIPHILI